jgi:hypothetical protein
MWFKVVFDKDGGVRSCDIASTLYEGTDLVVFVDADNRTDAIRQAKREYIVKRKKVTRQHRISSGLCVERMQGCEGKASPGKRACFSCLRLRASRKAPRNPAKAPAHPSEPAKPKGKPGAPRGVELRRRAALVEVLEKSRRVKSLAALVAWLNDEIARIDAANASLASAAE